MFDPLSLVAPYSINQVLQDQCVYATTQGTDELLDLSRLINESGEYYWNGFVLPDSDRISVGSQATINGSVQIPPGSYVTSINAYCHIANPAGWGNGFNLKIYDKGTKASIFYGDYILGQLVASMMQKDPLVGVNPNVPFGQGYLLSPFIITNPGVLGWEIVNRNTSTATIQVMLSCAVPVNRKTINKMVVSRG